MARDPYADAAPIKDPYDDFSSAVDGYTRSIQQSNRETDRANASRKAAEAATKREAARAAAVSMTARNKITHSAAKEGGYDKYLFKGEGGAYQSALNPEQHKELEDTRRAKEEHVKAKEAASINADYLSRKKSGLKDTMLSDSKREKADLELVGVDQQIELNEGFLAEGGDDFDQKDYDETKKRLELQRETLANQIGADDTAKAEYSEVDKDYNAAKDFGKLPKGLVVPDAVPEDPAERVELIQSYNTRSRAYDARNKALATARKGNLDAHQQRELAITDGYAEWRKSGGTPEQIKEAQTNRDKALSDSYQQYLQQNYTNTVEGDELMDVEYKSLQILKPFIEDVSKAHGKMQASRVKELRSSYTKELTQTAKDIGKVNPESEDQITELSKQFSEGAIDTETFNKGYQTAMQGYSASKGKHNDRVVSMTGAASTALGDGGLEVLSEKQYDSANPNSITKGSDGKWESDAFYSSSGTLISDKKKGEGNWTQNILNWKPLIGVKASINVAGGVADLAGKLGGFAARSVGVKTDANWLDEWQNKTGATDAETKEAFSDLQMHSARWKDLEETHRVTSKGDILFNQNLDLLDADRIKAIIKSADAPEFIKQRMLQPASIESIRDNYYATHINGIDMASNSTAQIGFNDWSNQQIEKTEGWANQPAADKLQAYLAIHNTSKEGSVSFGDDSWADMGKRFSKDMVLSANKLNQMWVGGANLIVDSNGLRDTLEEMAEGGDIYRQQRDLTTDKGGIGTFVMDVAAEESLPMAVSILSGGVGGKVAQTILARTVTGKALSFATQKAIVTNTAFGGMVGASGVQSFSLSLSDNYMTEKASMEASLGRELNDTEEKELMNSPDVQGKAIHSGFITGVITAAFGKGGLGGVESIAGKGIKNVSMRDFWRQIGNKSMPIAQKRAMFYKALVDMTKPIVGEGAEEMADEMYNALVIDNKTFGTAMEEGWEAFKAGAILGVSGSVSSMTTSGVNAQNLSSPETAGDALIQLFGEAGKFEPVEIEQGIALLNGNPANGGATNPEFIADKLKVSIETQQVINTQLTDARATIEQGKAEGDDQKVTQGIEATQEAHRSSGLIKAANGAKIESLPLAEQTALKANLVDGTAGSYVVGDELVITDTAIQQLKATFPEAATRLVAMNETQQLKKISDKVEREKAKAAAGDKKEGGEIPTPAAKPAAKTPAPTEKKAKPIRRGNGKAFSSEGTAKLYMKKQGIDSKTHSITKVEDGGFEITPNVEAPSGGKAKAESAPAAGKKFKVAITQNDGGVRFVEVEAESKKAAEVIAAGEHTNKGETIPANMTEEIAQVSQQTDPAPTKGSKPTPNTSPKTPAPVKAAPVPVDRQTELSGMFSKVTEEKGMKEDFRINPDGSLTLKEGLSKKQAAPVIIQALSARAAQKSITDTEAQTMWSAMPVKLQTLIEKRFKSKNGNVEMTPLQGTRFLLENMLNEKVFRATLKAHMRGGDRKIVQPLLQFFRKFIRQIRSLIKTSPDSVKDMLYQYEDFAMAMIKESISVESLNKLGIATPATKITKMAEASLPSNISPTRGGGYTVTMPDGSTKLTRTINQALKLNATKFEKQFEKDFLSANAQALIKGSVTRDEILAKIDLIKELFRVTAPKGGYSAESMFAAVDASQLSREGDSLTKFVTGLKSDLDAAGIALHKDAIELFNSALVKEVGDTASRKFDKPLLTEGSAAAAVRQMKEASSLGGIFMKLFRDTKNLTHLGLLFKANREWMEKIATESELKSIKEADPILEERGKLTDQFMALTVEDYLAKSDQNLNEEQQREWSSEELRKERNRIFAEIKTADEMLAEVYDNAFSEVQARRGNTGGANALQMPLGERQGEGGIRKQTTQFGKKANATSGAHEFIHILDGMVDPITGRSFMEIALGGKGMDVLNSWLIDGVAEGGNPKELLAEAMEKYLRDGNVPSNIKDSVAILSEGAQRYWESLSSDTVGSKQYDARSKAVIDQLFKSGRTGVIKKLAKNAKMTKKRFARSESPSFQATPTTKRAAMHQQIEDDIESFLGRKIKPPKGKNFFEKKDVTPKQIELQKEIADVYESLPINNLKDERVMRSYLELVKEIGVQWEAMSTNIEVVNWVREAGDPRDAHLTPYKSKKTGKMMVNGEPYPSSTAMLGGLEEGTLRILKTDDDAFGAEGEKYDGHPLLGESSKKDINGVDLLWNDVFRAVHDTIAHGYRGAQFGAIGEEAAWHTHARTIENPWARAALTMETRGQNSWVNYGNQVRNADGEIIKAGEEGYTSPAERSFAPQKAGILPWEHSLTGDVEVDAPILEMIKNESPAFQSDTQADLKAHTDNMAKKYGSTTKSMLEVLADRKSEYADLARALLKSHNKKYLNAPISFDPNEKRGSFEQGGKITFDYKANPKTMIHEYGHIVTTETIDNDLGGTIHFTMEDAEYREMISDVVAKGVDGAAGKRYTTAQREMFRLFDVAQKTVPQLTKAGIRPMRTVAENDALPADQQVHSNVAYGMANIFEFTAQALSNPNMQEFLNNIPDPNGKGTLLDTFFDAVRKILGVPVKLNSVLASTLNVMNDVATETDAPSVNFQSEANATEAKLYSKLARTLDQKIQGKKAAANQVKGLINKAGLKPEEIKWSGIMEWLDSRESKSILKSDLMDYLEGEGSVVFEEAQAGGDFEATEDELAHIDDLIKAKNQAFYYEVVDDEDYINEDMQEEAASEFERGVEELSQGNIMYAMLAFEESASKTEEAGYDPTPTDAIRSALEELVDKEQSIEETQYEDYASEGGKNYREVVLTMPSRKFGVETAKARLAKGESLVGISKGKSVQNVYDVSEIGDLTEFRSKDEKSYTSSHFNAFQDYVAHSRLKDKVSKDGKEGLFIEEIQSDRHQDGRKDGYETEDTKREVELATIKEDIATTRLQKRAKEIRLENGLPLRMQELMELGAEAKRKFDKLRDDDVQHEKLMVELLSARSELGAARRTGRVVDAPYRKDWGVQMFKRALLDAVNSGKEWIGWADGKSQADRYKMSKQIQEIDAIRVEDGNFMVTALPVGSNQTIDVGDKDLTPDELHKYVGKDLAAKIIAQGDESVSYAGLDLDVGGEGMKGFYDNMLPKAVQKLIKPMGGKVERDTDMTAEGDSGWVVAITPELKQSVSKGMPLFQTTPSESAAGKAAAARIKTPQPDIDQMMDDRGKFNKDGTKVVEGDPSKAKWAKDQDTRNAEDVLKEMYKESFEAQNVAQYEAEAAILANDPASIEQTIYELADGNPNVAVTGGFVIAASRHVANKMQSAITSGNAADINEALVLGFAHQESRANPARLMQAMKDPFQTPQQRAAYALGTAIHTPSNEVVNALKKKFGAKKDKKGSYGAVPQEEKQAYMERLAELQTKRYSRAKKQLEKDGMDVGEIFNAKHEGLAVGTAADTAALEKLTGKQKQIVKMWREGANDKEIKAATGVDPKSQKKTMDKFRDEAEKQAKEIVKQGYRVDTMDDYRAGRPPSKTPQAPTEADLKDAVKDLVERSFRGGEDRAKTFNILDPRDVMAAFRSLEKLDEDFVTRLIGTWYANVFSAKTVAVNLLSIPFAGYRMFVDRGAEVVFNSYLQNPDAASAAEFDYLKEGWKEWYAKGAQQALIAFDVERAYFSKFIEGGEAANPYSGESSEEVRGYQMGHVLDYVDEGIAKLMKGRTPKRPATLTRLIGAPKTKDFKIGKLARVVLRFNLGVDEFLRYNIAGSEVSARAYREGTKQGLTGEDLKKFIRVETRTAGSNSWVAAGNQADISVFTEALPTIDNLDASVLKDGDILSLLGDSMAAVVGAADNYIKDSDKKLKANAEVADNALSAATSQGLRLALGGVRITVMPFTRVIMNLIRKGFHYVPNPMVVAITSYKVSKYAMKNRGNPDPEAAHAIHRLSSQIVSSIIAASIYGLAEGDEDDAEKDILITGSMDKFGDGAKSARQAAYAEGMGQYRIRAFGKTFDYGRIDPAAITLGTTIDMIRNLKKTKRGDQGLWDWTQDFVANTMLAQMTDKTMLRGINDLMLMKDEKKRPEQWLARQLATFLVPNLIRQPIRDTNEFYGETGLEDENMEGFARILASELYPNDDKGSWMPDNPNAAAAGRDAFGNKMKRADFLGKKLPVVGSMIDWILKPQDYKKVRENELVRAYNEKHPLDKSVTIPSKKTKTFRYTDPRTGNKADLPMTNSQWDIYNRLYRSFYRTMPKPLKGDEGAKKVKPTVEKARKLAMAAAMINPTFMKDTIKTHKKYLSDNR